MSSGRVHLTADAPPFVLNSMPIPAPVAAPAAAPKPQPPAVAPGPAAPASVPPTQTQPPAAAPAAAKPLSAPSTAAVPAAAAKAAAPAASAAATRPPTAPAAAVAPGKAGAATGAKSVQTQQTLNVTGWVGLIIGAKGQTVKQLCADFGVHIRILDDVPGKETVVITSTGNPAAVDAAAAKIRAMIEAAKSTPGVHAKPAYTRSVPLPAGSEAAVIGLGGATVRGIMQATATRVRVVHAAHDGAPSTAEVSGDSLAAVDAGIKAVLATAAAAAAGRDGPGQGREQVQGQPQPQRRWAGAAAAGTAAAAPPGSPGPAPAAAPAPPAAAAAAAAPAHAARAPVAAAAPAPAAHARPEAGSAPRAAAPAPAAVDAPPAEGDDDDDGWQQMHSSRRHGGHATGGGGGAGGAARGGKAPGGGSGGGGSGMHRGGFGGPGGFVPGGYAAPGGERGERGAPRLHKAAGSEAKVHAIAQRASASKFRKVIVMPEPALLAVVVGVRGKTVFRISDEAGVTLVTDRDTGSLTIHGDSEEAIAKAEAMVEEVVAYAQAKGKPPHHHRGGDGEYGGGASEGRRGAFRHDAPRHSQHGPQ